MSAASDPVATSTTADADVGTGGSTPTSTAITEPRAVVSRVAPTARLAAKEHRHVHNWEDGQRSFWHAHPWPTDSESPDAAHPHSHSNGRHSHPHGHELYDRPGL